MTRHPSAVKRNRQNIKRRARNQDIRSKMRTSIKNTLKVTQEGDKEKTLESFKKSASVIFRTVSKGIIHKKNASRKVSRLAKKVAAL